MSNYIKVNCNGTEVLIEAEIEDLWEDEEMGEVIGDRGSSYTIDSDPYERVEIPFTAISNTINAYCSSLVNTFKNLQSDNLPDTITAEFGFKLNTDGEVFIVNSSQDASLKITAQWNLRKGLLK
ncbi:hypothetical protein MCHI_001049 [Candidatus Magnetoovum chiemensis]|nr:hypothetical protein MCHI_001049 [Candidatus Magnetoovum chiemensis]